MTTEELHQIVNANHLDIKEEFKDIKKLLSISNNGVQQNKIDIAVTKSRYKIVFFLLVVNFSIIGYLVKAMLSTN